MSHGPRKKLGEALIEAGLIDAFQLRSALADQRRWGNRLGKTLVKLGFVAEADLMSHLSRALGMPVVDLAGREIQPEVLGRVPAAEAGKLRCLPLFVDDEAGARFFYVAMEEPDDVAALDALRFRTGMEVCPVLIGFAALDDALRRYYDVDPDDDRTFDPSSPDSFEIASDDPVWADLDCLRHDADTGEPLDEASEKPREVPTRVILQALTRVLLEKRIITRDELFRTIESLAPEDEAS